MTMETDTMQTDEDARAVNIERLRLAREKARADKEAGIKRPNPKDLKHTVRSPVGDVEVASYTMRRAIRVHCTECLGWEGEPKKACTDGRCPLFPFRGRFTSWTTADPQLSC